MDADSYWGRLNKPLEYHVAWFWIAGFLASAAYFCYQVWPLILKASLKQVSIVNLVQIGIFVSIPLILLIPLFFLSRGFIRVTSERVDYRLGFRTSSMRRDEFSYKEKYYGPRGEERYHFVSKSGRQMKVITTFFGVDQRFNKWFESLPTVELSQKWSMK